MTEHQPPSGGSRSAETSPAADRVARALIRPLYESLLQLPHKVRNAEALAARLSASLSERLVSSPLALITALSPSDDDGTRGGTGTGEPATAGERNPIEARVLAAVRSQPAGRSPGLTPDALLALTGLEAAALGSAVSALVQAGALVRDAWLVRLPETGDLLVPSGTEERVATRRAATEEERGVDRRAIGDRRVMGERRLFDRRQPPG
jgi:hypothetical protein